MLRKMMRGKIHRATITFCDADYVGSATIDADLLRAADIRPNESVHVLDIDNGERFETYVIRGEAGSGVIGINGAAANLVERREFTFATFLQPVSQGVFALAVILLVILRVRAGFLMRLISTLPGRTTAAGYRPTATFP